jgi:uncharacterized membrane protein
MLISWQKHPGLRSVLWAAMAFFLIALTLTLHRYYTFYASYDQGIFNQVFWNNLHGRLFESSLSSNLSSNVVHDGNVPEVFYHRLGQHFTPALLLWLPVYALFPGAATLAVLQVTLVTAAGLVLYALARQHLAPPLAALITISFYGANTVLGPTLNNFHDICQIPLFVFGLLLALQKRWWWLFGILTVLILLVREDAGVVLFSIGFYLTLSRRSPRLGLLLCGLSFTYMLVLTNLIMPLFSDDVSHRFMIERFGQYTNGESASTLQVIWSIIRNPWRLVVEIFTPVGRTVRYLLGHWLPLALVPAIAPQSWLLAGFPLVYQLMAQGDSVLSINIRYAMTIAPGLFYGAVLWWEQHPQAFKPWVRRFWLFCISLSLLFTLTSNPNRTLSFLIPDSIDPWVYVSLPQRWSHAAQIQTMLARIPSDASVSATTYLIPHLSSRRALVRFPMLQFRDDAQVVVMVEYAIADLWQLQQYQAAFKADAQLLKDNLQVINQITQENQYGMIGFEDGVLLLQKGVASEPAVSAAWQDFRNRQ